MDFAVPADRRVKLKESKKKDNYQDLAWELKNLWNMKVTVIPIVIGALGAVTKWLIKELEDLEIRRRVETIPNDSIIKIGKNIWKCPRDTRKPTVT